jgi:hypothetical protein
MLIETDHDLAQDEHLGGVDDKCQLETVLAKILDQAFKQLQDYENVSRFLTVN